MMNAVGKSLHEEGYRVSPLSPYSLWPEAFSLFYWLPVLLFSFCIHCSAIPSNNANRAKASALKLMRVRSGRPRPAML